MASRLRTDVHVEKDGQPVILEAGSAVPKWAAKLVTNPKAFIEIVEEEQKGTDTDADASAATGYDGLKGPQLKALLKARELPQSGTNPEMIARLKEFDADQAEENAGGADDEHESNAGEGSSEDDADDENQE